MKYPKLVRDKIPAIIKKDTGKQPAIRILTDDKEYLQFLLQKLVEEAQELQKATNKFNQLEELADLMEVMEAIILIQGWSLKDVMGTFKAKHQKRGGFKKRIVLLKI